MDFSTEELTASIVTKEDLLDKLYTLSSLGTKVFEESLREKALQEIISQLGLKKDSEISKEDLTLSLQEAEKFLRGLKTISITLAFEPARDFLKQIKAFLEASLKTVVVIDLTIDTEIVAGVTIEHNGLYRDYSARGNLEKAFEDKTFLKGLFAER